MKIKVKIKFKFKTKFAEGKSDNLNLGLDLNLITQKSVLQEVMAWRGWRRLLYRKLKIL